MSERTEIPERRSSEYPRIYGEEPIFQNYRIVIEIDGEKEATVFKGLSEAEVKTAVQRYLDKLPGQCRLLSMTHSGYVRPAEYRLAPLGRTERHGHAFEAGRNPPGQ
jgi:hypothetical protein